jgi:hypothetical protein
MDAVAYANLDCTKNSVQADDVIEGDDPEESVDLAWQKEIVEDVCVAEATMKSEEV